MSRHLANHILLSVVLISGCLNEIHTCPRTYVRGAPPLPSSEPDSFEDRTASKLYEVGKKIARLEDEYFESTKVLYFIHCVSRTTGRDFVVEDLHTASAKRCRIETNEAAEQPDFLERVDELEEHTPGGK